MALKLGLNLQTHAAVTSVQSDVSGHWKILTGSREISATKVIHATNGYSSYLLPELTAKIVPLKGHVAAIRPSPDFAKAPLDNTMAFIWDSDYDYLIQRRVNGRHLILGGRDLDHSEGLTGPLGDSDDSIMNEEIARGLVDLPRKQFKGWAQLSDNVQDSTKTGRVALDAQIWTGIMGISKDCLPFLGELPGKTGQYIAAGYHGHGK
jgi:glycine/D-amino acid oxidase-like deaminating enzyme